MGPLSLGQEEHLGNSRFSIKNCCLSEVVVREKSSLLFIKTFFKLNKHAVLLDYKSNAFQILQSHVNEYSSILKHSNHLSEVIAFLVFKYVHILSLITLYAVYYFECFSYLKILGNIIFVFRTHTYSFVHYMWLLFSVSWWWIFMFSHDFAT